MGKPSYLGLLNAVANAEARGGELFSAWAAATPNDALRETLAFVALREHEHAAAFAKRISELGYSVQERPDPGFAKRLKKAGSKASDLKKFKKVLGYDGTPREDSFSRFFDDATIDPHTGALLGRFIAEERDSTRRLQACYRALSDGTEAEDDPLLLELAERLDRLTDTLTDLKSLREES